MDFSKLAQAMGPFQQAMQQQAAERAKTVLEGKSGGGAVTVRLRGDLQLESLTIAPAAAQAAGGDVSMLEDLVQAAINDVLRQYRTKFGATPDEQLQKLAGGGNLGALIGPLMGALGK